MSKVVSCPEKKRFPTVPLNRQGDDLNKLVSPAVVTRLLVTMSKTVLLCFSNLLTKKYLLGDVYQAQSKVWDMPETVSTTPS